MKIVIVEDDPGIRKELKQLLENAFYEAAAKVRMLERKIAQAEEKNTQEVANNNNVFEIASSNDNVNSSSSFILPVVIAVIVVIVAGSLCYLCYKKKNTGTHNEEK